MRGWVNREGDRGIKGGGWMNGWMSGCVIE